MTKIVTHDSGFHTDDVFAVATLLLAIGDAEITRTRDPNIQASADYLVDTGMEYKPDAKRFDHHQPEGAGARVNGIPYASFGLVWKEYGETLAGGQREAEYIDRTLVQSIDAHDNGVAVYESKFKGVREYTIGDYFYSFVTSREQSALNETFRKVVGIAKELLIREIDLAKHAVKCEDEILSAYNASQDKRIVVFPRELMGWKDVLGNTPDAIYGIHPRPDGHWSLGAVPDLSKPFGTIRKPLPLDWAGKQGEELKKISGVDDALFTHRKRFMASTTTREGAIKLAQIALNS